MFRFEIRSLQKENIDEVLKDSRARDIARSYKINRIPSAEDQIYTPKNIEEEIQDVLDTNLDDPKVPINFIKLISQKLLSTAMLHYELSSQGGITWSRDVPINSLYGAEMDEKFAGLCLRYNRRIIDKFDRYIEMKYNQMIKEGIKR